MCLIAGSAPTYRQPIYSMIGNELGCDFILGSGPTKQMNITELPNKVIAVCPLKIGKSPIFHLKGALRLSKDYDVLILCMGIISITEWLILFSAKFRHQKAYIWSHGWLGKDSWIKKMIGRLYFGLSSGVFVYNERSVKLMTEGGIPKEKLYTIYNSLNYDLQLGIRKSLTGSAIYTKHFGNQYHNIVFIGRLMKVKRFDLLLEAISILKEKGEIINVTFIGDGKEKECLEKMVHELGINKQFWFYGASFDERTNAELIYNADLCVSPGNIGLTAMHVLMFGCPAITNDDFNHQMPEFEAIRAGRTGDFFKAGNSKSLADAISKWFLEHANDRESVRRDCYHEIDTKWNPHNQMRIFKQVLS